MNSYWQQVRQSLSPLVRGSRHWAGTMAESLRRQVTMQKLAVRIRALNHERSELVRAVGKKVYSLHTRGKVRNRDVLSDCRRIDEAGQEIDALRQQLEEVRFQAAAGEQLVVEIEDEVPLAEEAEGEEGPTELPEEEIPQWTGERLGESVDEYYKRPEQEVQEREVNRIAKTAGDIMTTEVVTTTLFATVARIAQILAEKKISGLPVVSAGKVVGIISEADILTTAEDATVESVMVCDVISVEPDACVTEVAKILADKGIKRVPVIDPAGTLVGIVSRADIVAALAASE